MKKLSVYGVFFITIFRMRTHLDFLISSKGKAKNIKVVSATSVAFQNSAMKALKASTSYITMKNGKAFHQRATRKYVFDIEKTQTK